MTLKYLKALFLNYTKDGSDTLMKWKINEMNEKQQSFRQYADLIKEYGNRIVELVATMDKAEDATQQFNYASQLLCDIDVHYKLI